jgi:hypothetical protein
MPFPDKIDRAEADGAINYLLLSCDLIGGVA